MMFWTRLTTESGRTKQAVICVHQYLLLGQFPAALIVLTIYPNENKMYELNGEPESLSWVTAPRSRQTAFFRSKETGIPYHRPSLE